MIYYFKTSDELVDFLFENQFYIWSVMMSLFSTGNGEWRIYTNEHIKQEINAL